MACFAAPQNRARITLLCTERASLSLWAVFFPIRELRRSNRGLRVAPKMYWTKKQRRRPGRSCRNLQCRSLQECRSSLFHRASEKHEFLYNW